MSLIRAAAVALAAGATVALDLLAHPHGDAWWHHALGFDLLYGFAGCAVIVIVSKALGKAGLQQGEHVDEASGDAAE